MDSNKERHEKYFTEEGVKFLKNQLDNLVKLYNEEFKQEITYPFREKMLGSGDIILEHKEELFYRIREIVHIIGDIEITTETNKVKDEIIKKIRVKYG